MQDFPLAQAAYIVDARIEKLSVPTKRLQTATHLRVFLQNTNIVTFFGKQKAAFQTAQARSDDDNFHKIKILPLYCQFQIDEPWGKVVGYRCLNVVDVGNPDIGGYIIDSQNVKNLKIKSRILDGAEEFALVFHTVAALFEEHVGETSTRRYHGIRKVC